MSTRISAEDYTHLLSLEYWEFIKQVNRWLPDDFSAQTVDEQRLAYHAMLSSLASTYPIQLMSEDYNLSTRMGLIPVRSYQMPHEPIAAQLIYFHGGGFVLGGLESHHGICADLCAGTGLQITAVAYRLAPEHLFPAALEDAVAAYQALAEQSHLPLIVMGDSAGGCLAAHVAHRMRGQARAPLAQVLVYPVLGSDLSLDSYERYALAPLLSTASMESYWQSWLGSKLIPKQLAGIPLAEQNFSHLPKTIIFSAEFDPLVDEASLYCEKIQAAGGQATWYLEQGLTHGYLHARHQLASAKLSFARIQAVLKDLVA